MMDQGKTSAGRQDLDVVHWSFAAATGVLGVVLMLAPNNWFGPSWSYFSQVPHNGFWMGLTCTVLSLLQLATLWRGGHHHVLGYLVFLTGVVFWTGGVIIAAAGILGHQGLMETPFMMGCAIFAYSHAGGLLAQERKKKTLLKLIDELADPS